MRRSLNALWSAMVKLRHALFLGKEVTRSRSMIVLNSLFAVCGKHYEQHVARYCYTGT